MPRFSLGLGPLVSGLCFILAAVVACSSSDSGDAAQTAADSGAGTVKSGTGEIDASLEAGDPDASTWEWTPPPPQPTRSQACGAAMADAVGVDSTTPSGRTFHVWGPQGYDPNKAYPVVVMFHGWYTDGRSFESWFQMEQYVNNEAFVVYPDAANQLWDLEGTSDLVFFDDLVKTLGETYCIDPSRVFGFGFSYGGKFAHHLGCQRAGYVKAISVGDGSWGLDPLQCGRLPVLVTHRTHDNDELVAWGKTAADNWVTINGCTADTTISDPTMNCTLHPNCRQPGGTTTFCEDTWFDATWPNDWNHTVREPYRTFTWQWFAALP